MFNYTIEKNIPFTRNSKGMRLQAELYLKRLESGDSFVVENESRSNYLQRIGRSVGVHLQCKPLKTTDGGVGGVRVWVTKAASKEAE